MLAWSWLEEDTHTKGEGDASMLLLLSWLAGVVGGCCAFSGAVLPPLDCAAAGVALPGSGFTTGASSTFMGSAPSSALTATAAWPLSTTVQPAHRHQHHHCGTMPGPCPLELQGKLEE